MQIVSTIKGLGNVLSITDATGYATEPTEYGRHDIVKESFWPKLADPGTRVLLVGRGTTGKKKPPLERHTALAVLTRSSGQNGGTGVYEINRKILNGHTFYNPTDILFCLRRNFWLAANDLHVSHMRCTGDGDFIFSSGLPGDPLGSVSDYYPEINSVAKISDGAWALMTDRGTIKLLEERLIDDKYITYTAKTLWDWEIEDTQQEIDEGLVAISFLGNDAFLVGGDMRRLYVLRKDPDGKYYIAEEIVGFEGMVWAITKIGENTWLAGGDRGELRTLTLTDGAFSLGARVEGFSRENHIRTIYKVPGVNEAIVGGLQFCYVLTI